MSEDSLVTASEVAKLAGVGRAAVSNWRRRYTDFPEPVGGSGSSPSFRYAEIERWLRQQGRLTVSPIDALWRTLESGDADVTTSVAQVAMYLAGEARDTHLAPEVLDQAARLDDVTRTEAVEYLVRRLFERQQRQHLTTPQGLADLIVRLAEPLTGSVFDPACGPGTVLRTAAQSGACAVHGQELDPDLARLATARLALTSTDAAPIAVGDALRADAHPALRADVVLCDPPFGYRGWGHDELVIDPRWEYGTPPKTEPELAWLQHCLAHTAPGSTVVMVMPAGVSSRRAGRTIRKELLRAGALRAVIALPTGVLMSTGIPLHVWVLRNPDKQSADPVLLVDTSHLAPERRGRADWDTISAAVLEPWGEFGDTGTATEVAGRHRTIDIIDLLDEDVDLTPSRHLPLPALPLDVDKLQRDSTELAASLRELAARLPTSVREGQRDSKSTTTINDLAKAGALTGRRVTGRLETTDAADADGPLVLTSRDVAAGAAPTARLATLSDNMIELYPGDVVAPMVVAGDRPCAEVIETDGWILGQHMQLLRVDPDRLDPHFLAGVLRTQTLLRSATTSSGGLRLDFRRVEIPVLDIDEQRRIGEQLRRLHAVERGLRDATKHGTAFVRQLTDALAAGAVDVV